MKFFKRKEPTRRELLSKAAKARGKGRRKKAILIYQKLLASDPNDFEVHVKIAPLLMKNRQTAEAAKSFKIAAQGYYEKKLVDKTISVYRQAARCMPAEVGLWERIAKLNLERNRKADAIKTLIEGSRKFRKKALKPQRIRLLRKAFEIEPWHFQVSYDLAKLLAKNSERKEARDILAELCRRVHHGKLRKARRALFFISPNLPNALGWLRAFVSGR